MAPHDVAAIGRALEDEGADALALINTIPGMSIDVRTRKSRLARPTAGVSGPAIHAIAVRMVWECAQAVSLPICGIGGVASVEDAAEMILAGATAVSVGTANLTDPLCAARIASELVGWVASQGVDDVNKLIGAFEG
jgi:dihydroorotate dehydrogenase (NAD+) catalytic subunit